MSEQTMYLDHVVCLSCGSVRDKALRVYFAHDGMEAGVYPYPVAITAGFARRLASQSHCLACDVHGPFALALRPMEAR